MIIKEGASLVYSRAERRYNPVTQSAGSHPGTRPEASNDANSGSPEGQRLIDLGIAARQRGEHASALDYFKAAVALGIEDARLQIEIAVANLGFSPPSEKRLSEAAACCDAVLRKTPLHARATYLLGLIARQRGDHLGSLAHMKKAADLRPQHLDYRLEIARTLRALGRLKRATEYCQGLLKEVPDNVRVLVMLGTIACESSDYTSALAHFELAAQKDPLNLDVQERVAKTLHEMGRPDEAANLYRKVLAQNPRRGPAMLGLLSILRKQKHSAAAIQEAQAVAANAPENIRVRLEVARMLLTQDRLDEASSAYRAVLDAVKNNVPAVLGLAEVARAAAEWETALAHFTRAAALKPDDPKIQFEIAAALFELLRREEADSVVRRCDEDPLMSCHIEYRIQKLRYFCRTLQFDRAKEAMSCWPTHRDIPEDAVGWVACLHAVRGEWEQIFELLRKRAVDGSRLSSPGNCEMLIEAVARAARHTGRYEEVLALADRWPDHTTRAMAATLRDQTLEEVLLLSALGMVPGVPCERETALQLPVRAERHSRRAAVLSGLSGSAGSVPNTTCAIPHVKGHFASDRTIYYCTDTSYLLGAAVSLFSLLRNNRELACALTFSVYCESEAFGFASQVFANIAAHFGTSIDVRDTAGLLPDSSGFRTIRSFRGLVRLSEAAYFRIYAALQLIREKRGRALYIDSDTCVGPGLDTLLDFDLAGMPLAAWHESASQEAVRRPTKRLGLKPGTYFNSGVLLFDLSHPQLEAALHRSLDVALNQQHLLTFLDQDCLNAAFKDLTVSLPDTCNFFVRDEEEIDCSNRPVVTHFTGHPKPWDPWYQTGNCIPWFDEFVCLGEILGPEMTRRLLRSHFEQAPSRPSTYLSAAE